VLVGSFAYFTIKDRLPQILTRVIDTLHRHKNEFFEEHGEVRVRSLFSLMFIPPPHTPSP
uniref:Uncharacterized protein n=1 Tax=Corvus moneduloides TaxID=1196302 RepID=A0A8U7ME00_CORMO